VAYFFEPILDGHDRQDVEVYGYGNVEFPDEITERLIEKFDCYRDIRSLDDQAAAELVERDRIDILVDLAGHVGDNRLLVMARKPAPIQLTYLGYPDTTGLTAIDYRLTDVLADPPDSGAQRFYTEELAFLPDGFLCYRPPDFASALSPLPAADADLLTFGSFNNGSKINPPLIRMWADLLRANPNSRLLLKLKGGDDPLIAANYLERFEETGLNCDRVDIIGWKTPEEHLKAYAQVDIALDTYPYNGTTTTCEALWMGVPVISLVGECHASRVGLSILTRLGLEFFAASTPQEYIAKATALATNLPALARIRRTMRARIAASGLCHAKGFARQIEAAYRRMWYRWCRLGSSRRRRPCEAETVAECRR
jgi:predicted O-linked N-acetylglucosamine transferase (SPINDLY family)